MIKLTGKQATRYKKNWAAINAAQREEMRKLSFRQKFYQTASLIRMGVALKLDRHEDQEKRAVRRRWALLKKKIL